MSSGPSGDGDRPVTSKARGICRYYNTSRGCYAGDKCKFLHGEAEKYTPYDKSKGCRFYAAGFCRRGDQCWFKHVNPEDATPDTAKSEEDEFDVCSICYEKPVTYGLLEGCTHQFCLKCIREWRNPEGKSEEMRTSRVNKMCPLCRSPSRFVTPSSLYYPEGHPGKAEAVEKYKASMARTPCRHFTKSPPNDRFCPFGKECFYQHVNDDGTPYVFEHGADYYMQVYSARRPENGPGWFESDFDDMLASIAGLNATFHAYRSVLPAMSTNLADAQPNGGPGEDDSARAETMQRLVTLMANVEEFFGMSTAFVDAQRQLRGEEPSEATTSNLQDAEDVELTGESLFPVQPEEETMDDATAMPPSPMSSSASTGPPSLEDVSDSDAASLTSTSSSGASALSNPRFSTVVRGRGRYISDTTMNSFDDARSLPASAEVHAGSRASAQTGPTTDYQLEASPSFVEDLEQRMRDILHVDDPSPSALNAAPSTATTIEPQHEQAKDTAVDFVAMQEPDPPFLTDGRGRVVWSSNTAAARQRESRRSRASTTSSSTAQHKTNDAARTPSRPRRAHTYPDVSLAEVGCSTSVVVGRGRVHTEPGTCIVASEIASAVAGSPGVEVVPESTDGIVGSSDMHSIPR